MCFSNFLWGRLIMVLTPILVHMWGLRTRIWCCLADGLDQRVLFRLWRGLMFIVENYNFKKVTLRISWCQRLFIFGFHFHPWLRAKAEILSACGRQRSIPPQVRKNLPCPKGTLRVRSPSSKNGMDLYHELILCYRTNPTASDIQNIMVFNPEIMHNMLSLLG